MGDSTVPVISHSGGVDRLLRHHGHRRTAASLSRNVAPGYRRRLPAWAQLGQARGGWRLRHGVGAALYCGRLVVATDEEFAREPSRLDEGLAMAPRKVDKQARRRYSTLATAAPGAGCHALGPSSPGALRARNAHAPGAALVACSRRLRTPQRSNFASATRAHSAPRSSLAAGGFALPQRSNEGVDLQYH